MSDFSVIVSTVLILIVSTVIILFISSKMDAIKLIVSQIDNKTNEIKGLTAKLAQEIDAMKNQEKCDIGVDAPKKKRTRKILTDEEKKAKKAKMDKKKEEKKDEEKEDKKEEEEEEGEED